MRNLEPSHALDRTPVRLGRYEIVHKLGAGGMADVYLAHQPGPFSAGKLSVIKRLRTGVFDDAQFVHMFADESRIAVRLQHPNVVQTYEAVAEGQDFYLVLEFLDGKSLYQILTQVTRELTPLNLHLWILVQVLSGLHYAHELKEFDGNSMGIVHRDVSPSNVFVTYNGEVKLLDFGIAKSVGAATATREGIIKGKLGYAAPEQCLCKSVDRRGDIFAVGVMLWEAVAARRRPMGETDASTYQARVQGTELPIDQAVPDAPKALVAICNRALAREPEARYQTALEFRQALERYLQSLGWRNGSEQLHRFMLAHFSADVEAVRQRIDEYFGRSRSMGAAPSLSLGDPSVSASPYGTDGAQGGHASGAKEVVSRGLHRPLVRWAVAAAGVLTFGVGAWVAGGRRSPQAAVSVAPSAEGTTSFSSTKIMGASEPAPVAQITLSLTAKPDGAELRLDGRKISNPYRAAHGPDKSLHHLTASLEGYSTIEQDIAFEKDIELALSLSVQTPSHDLATPAPRVAVPRPAAQAARAPSLAAPVAQQPGDSLRGDKRAARIDEADPYGH